MLRAIILAAGLLSAPAAVALDAVATAPSWQTFAEAAAATGQTDANGAPLAAGQLAGGGSWFYNAVGQVSVPTGAMTTCAGPGGAMPCPEQQTLPGVWVRVRFNGDVANLAQLATWRSLGVTIYLRQTIGGVDCWSSDGATCAPDYIDTIGVIAARALLLNRG